MVPTVPTVPASRSPSNESRPILTVPAIDVRPAVPKTGKPDPEQVTVTELIERAESLAEELDIEFVDADNIFS